MAARIKGSANGHLQTHLNTRSVMTGLSICTEHNKNGIECYHLTDNYINIHLL